MPLTVEDLSTINVACEAAHQIEKLQKVIDNHLDPICTKIVKEGNIDTIRELLKMLPVGFYSSEIRTYLNLLEIQSHNEGWNT